jgi:uncharacterized Zn-finger protein
VPVSLFWNILYFNICYIGCTRQVIAKAVQDKFVPSFPSHPKFCLGVLIDWAVQNISVLSKVSMGRIQWQCGTCGRVFKGSRGKDMCKTHYNTVHLGIKKHKCAICGKCFSQYGSRNRHQKTCSVGALALLQNEDNTVGCRYCNRRFVTRLSGKRHLSSCLHRPPPNRACSVIDQAPSYPPW